MSESPAVESNHASEVNVIETHWPLVTDGTPLPMTEANPPESALMMDEEWQAWQQMRAEDKAWQLANWDKRCKAIEGLFK